MQPNPRCIYCLEHKDSSAFNREHVVPRSFGTFGTDTLTIGCVCQECNSFFSKDLELKFGRDSIEGLSRFMLGSKPAKKHKSFGADATTRTELLKEGVMAGVICGFYGGLQLAPLPQIGFSDHADGPYTYFLIDELPSRESIVKDREKIFVRYWSLTEDEANSALKKLDLAIGVTEEVPPEQGRMPTCVTFRISHPEFRTIAKIAFNYLACQLGDSFARLPNFNEIRRYVRYGVQPERRLVDMLRPLEVARISKQRTIRSHFITVERHDGLLVAQVSLFCRVRYLVFLSRDALQVDFGLSMGHVFDVEENVIVPTKPPPLYIE